MVQWNKRSTWTIKSRRSLLRLIWEARRESSYWNLRDSFVERAIWQWLLPLAEKVWPQSNSAGRKHRKNKYYNLILFYYFRFICLLPSNHLVKPNQRKKAREPIVYSTWINVLGYKRMRSILEETKESYPEKTNNPMWKC